MRVKEYSASVFVDGKALDELDVSVDEARHTATCYIPSQAGKKFMVEWRCLSKSRTHWSSGRVGVDGVWCKGKVIRSARSGQEDSARRSYFTVDKTTTRDFMFSNINLTDDETYLHVPDLDKLGGITLDIVRGVPETHYSSPEHRRSVKDSRTMHERAKKALVHCVGFGREKKRPIPSARTHKVRPTRSTLHFIFKYRPLAVLQAQGIASLPVPQRAPIKRSETIDDDVIIIDDGPENPAAFNANIHALEKRKLNRLRARQAASNRTPVKSEPGAPPAKRRVKREPDGSRSGQATEVIIIDSD
ncbi:hypothetical protein CONPUDRAFT_135860 [Coniophora puteana RWD-64-598 SS2]|uniref:DUF7918 domain-containing protein n=1 Tax=Coniophora puteana (strain RWD-64-598) TaxID=741705 RepID=A0A5M3N0I3_CONPW|nr:uncharacterized protein CONPUDRAFT_135860 [Coniophora puteana RWD-64-598 SS2]EIW84401.1 hypothetical protein CONPUDRAFT_135860 [Coniophora puteana RWD-64-598 SS2]